MCLYHPDYPTGAPHPPKTMLKNKNLAIPKTIVESAKHFFRRPNIVFGGEGAGGVSIVKLLRRV